ncbi:MAG: VOC family protein [Actinomycetota bacterium]|nr:VOC family protein [Actinomycetota bacterium]
MTDGNAPKPQGDNPVQAPPRRSTNGASSVRHLRVVIRAEDYDAAVAFYRDALALPETAAYQTDGGARVTILDAGRASLEIANPEQVRMIDEVEVGRPVSPPIRLAFEVGDVVGDSALLTAAGATLIAPATVTPWSSCNARLAAPAGVQLTLFQELEPPPTDDDPVTPAR